jgi:hypothetical protein
MTTHNESAWHFLDQPVKKTFKDIAKENKAVIFIITMTVVMIVAMTLWTNYSSMNEDNLIKQQKDEMLANLQVNLKQKYWRQADIITRALLRRRYSENPNVQLSCDDYFFINKIWIENSHGRFGLTVQKYLWQKSLSQAVQSKKWFFDDENSQALLIFGEAVGWRRKKENRWLRYDEIIFEASLEQFPTGYFPISWGEIDQHYWDMPALSQALNLCEIR